MKYNNMNIFERSGVLFENCVKIKTHFNSFAKLETSVEPLKSVILGIYYKAMITTDIMTQINDKMDSGSISEEQANLEITSAGLGSEQIILLHHTGFICDILDKVSMLDKCFKKTYVVEKIIERVTKNYSNTEPYKEFIDIYKKSLESGSETVETFIREISRVEVIIRELSGLSDDDNMKQILETHHETMMDSLEVFYKDSIKLLFKSENLLK